MPREAGFPYPGPPLSLSLSPRKVCLLINLRPPSNADILGSQLLGYRVYIRETRCEADIGDHQDADVRITVLESSCVERKTISDPGTTSARIGYLSKFEK